MQDRQFYVVSRDGTIIPASDCKIVHLTSEQVDVLLDDHPDSEVWDEATHYHAETCTVEDLVYSWV